MLGNAFPRVLCFLGLQLLTSGAPVPSIVSPVNYSITTSMWLDEEDVSVTSTAGQRVGTVQNDWQNLATWTTVDGKGHHMQLFRADLNMRFVVLAGQKCLVWSSPNGTVWPFPKPSKKVFQTAVNVSLRNQPAIKYMSEENKVHISVFVDSKNHAPLVQLQSNSGLLEDIFEYEPYAPEIDFFAVPDICKTNPTYMDTMYDFKVEHVSSRSRFRFPRMDTEMVMSLKEQFEMSSTPTYYKRGISKIPRKLDRRKSGNVAKVRNQGACGSCWSFSSAAAMETVISVATGEPAVSLSPQAIIDCTPVGVKTHKNLGLDSCRACAGGFPPIAFQNAINGTGIAAEEQYPYKGVEGQCNHYERLKIGISSYSMIQPGNEEDIIAAVAEHGAVSVLINVQEDFDFYTGGLYDNPDCGTDPAHAVTVVGYDEESYIVKNSWGSAWGEHGFIHMARGKNICGIANHAAVPIAAPSHK